MLLPEHEKYHTMAPKDVGLQGTTIIDVVRTTNQTGEQFHVQVPVYPDDTREAVKNRTNFFLSIIQDRMEDENKAVNKLNETRQLKAMIERNGQNFIKQKAALDKRLSRSKITRDEYDTELTKLQEGMKAANADILAKLDELGDKYVPPPVVEETTDTEAGEDSPEEN